MLKPNLSFNIVQWCKQISPFKGHANEQAGLVLVASVPCLVLALVCMRLAGASYYLISFFAIVLSLLVIYAAVTGRNRANYQIQTISNLVEAMIDGDYTLRGRTQPNPAFQDLLDLINKLSDNLHKHKLKAEESQLLLEKIMQQMDALVIAVDSSGQLAMINQAARKKFNFHSNLSNGFALDNLGLGHLADYAESGVVRFTQKEITGEYFLFKDQFYNNNQKHDLYLLTRADKMLREKEREAWQNLLRVLSHELNNSLTPIATFSNTMLRKINKENKVTDINKFRDGLGVIKERAESLNQFITSYSQLSHLPKANKQSYMWRDKLVRLTNLFNDCQFKLDLIDKPKFDFSIQADAQQLEQVFINVFKNAREAMELNQDKKITINVAFDDSNLVIKVIDNGAGIANPNNLFVPFYTTKKSGSGIGLTLCQQIINNHSGTISLANRSDKVGAEVVITLPLNS